MSSVPSLYAVEENSLSLREKDSDDYLRMMTDSIMGDLVRYNGHLQKAYNYYYGVRDISQFKNLTDKYGLGTPTDLKFVPLIQQHIDYLVNEFIGSDVEYSITCSDKSTLQNIYEQKRKDIYTKELDELKQSVNDSLWQVLDSTNPPPLNPPQGGLSQPSPSGSESLVQKLTNTVKEYEAGYISEFEEAAQALVESVKHNRDVDIQFLRMNMAKELLITNRCYHRVYSEGPDRIEIKNIDTRDVFHDFNKNSPYVRDMQRLVYRDWLSRSEAVARYGHLITKEEREAILDTGNTIGAYPSRNLSFLSDTGGTGIMGSMGLTVTADGSMQDYYDYAWMQMNQMRLIPVYHCEWLDTSEVNDDDLVSDDSKGKKHKKAYRQDRYETIVIGENIYILKGRDENAPRSKAHPMLTRLSVNGLYFPHKSLVMQTMELQDMYDILHFHMETVIGNSGTKGGNIDVSQLPKFLGDTPEDRVTMAIMYRKAGTSLWNTAEEERQGMPLANTMVTGFDDTLSSDTVNAYLIAIQQLEMEISQYTGVFKQSLVNGISTKDAVTNIQMGFKQEAILTRKYFYLFDLEMKEIYNDLIHTAQIAYKDGYVGNIIMGPTLSKVFTIDASKYTNSDFDVHIGDSSELIKEKELIRTMSMELTKADKIDPRLIMDMVTSKSLTKMKRDVVSSLDEKEKKEGAMLQLQQQLQQMTQKMQQMAQQLQQAQNENQQLTDQKYQIQMQIEQAKLQLMDKGIEEKRDYHEGMVEVQKERTKLEEMQLFDESKRNDEIRY